MTDFTQTTYFAPKDALTTGDPLKIVKGTEIDVEFLAISTAITSKANTSSPTLVTPNIGVATGTSLVLSGAATAASLGVTNNQTVGGTLGVTGVLTATGGVVGNVTGDVTGNADTSTTATNGVPVGTVIDFAGASAPSGYLACPTASGGGQLVSRTTYAALFTAIGTTWGVGDGSTTFGIPWFAAGYTATQANANVGTATTGENKAHTHTVGVFNAPGGTTFNIVNNSYDTQYGSITTSSSGGSANLAAGVAMLKCVKY